MDGFKIFEITEEGKIRREYDSIFKTEDAAIKYLKMNQHPNDRKRLTILKVYE